MVMEIGFRVKSGVLIPSGSTSTYWVIITPGTLDLFLIFTAIKQVKQKVKTLDLFYLIIKYVF